MQPSSLIFVVVIGIWAAFLIQYWVRRREHLATARSIDRFSAAMRVLDRRSRAARKSREDAGHPGSAAPAVADHPGESAERSRPAPLLSTRRSPLVARGAGHDSGGAFPPADSSNGATLRATSRRPSPASRRLRTVGLLLALSVIPVTITATALGLAPLWTLAVAVAEVALCFAALRLAAVRAQTAQRTDRSLRSSLSARWTGTLATAFPGDGVAASTRPPYDSAEEGADPSSLAAGAPTAPAYRPGDPTWRPVPVPRPTYQLKDPAPPMRRVRVPQQPFDGQHEAAPAAPGGSSRRVGSG